MATSTWSQRRPKKLCRPRFRRGPTPISGGSTTAFRSGAPSRGWDNDNTNYGGAVSERHLDTVNTLWIDGHVKAIKIDALGVRGTANSYARLSSADDG